MEKLIIENRSNLPMRIAVQMALEVVEQGRISNENAEYCYGTLFDINNDEYMVASYKNKKSDRLVVYKEPIRNKSK